ncbi:P2X purinoceptor 7-like [Paramisgurnus dabryanus]|uniref:P2X purinoceptor 7-like n=1 Tax=Paramisgurnus dabryanus TaxID=90735 RepID=UPI0031F3FE19
MDSETFEWEDEGFEVDFDGVGYRFEPEYSEEEFLQRKAEFELHLSKESSVTPVAEAAVVSRLTGTWWCSCRKCKQMPTEEESLCCTEWDLLFTEGMENLNVSVDETEVSLTCVTDRDVRDLLQRPVIETFFYVPKLNWKKRPRPEGLNGQLSDRQLRMVSYRVVLEWALKGQQLGRGNRVVLPSCVVWAVRDAFPSPTEQYTGFKEGEIEAVF